MGRKTEMVEPNNEKNNFWMEQSDLITSTDRCKDWLVQFDSRDRNHARMLVRHLTLVTASKVRRSIQKNLEIELDKKNQIALYCVRKVGDNEQYFPCDEGKKIDSLAAGSDHGSEALFSYLITKFKNINEDLLLSHPELEFLGEKNCANIIVIDDIAGSGDRVIKFLNEFHKKELVRNWLERGRITFKVIVYTCTKIANKLITQHPLKPTLIYDKICPTIQDTYWDANTRKSVLELCKKYGQNTSEVNMWNGYKDSSALLVFDHSCPNNVPAILWANPGNGKSWLPLFPNRTIKSEEMEIFSLQESLYEFRKSKWNSGKNGFTFNKNNYSSPRNENIVSVVLALIAKGNRKISSLCRVTGLKPHDCEKLLDTFTKLKIISESRRITDKGIKQLDFDGVPKKYRTIEIGRGQSEYFPKQLRRPMYD